MLLLSPEEVLMWLEHLAAVKRNRIKGAAKAAETRRQNRSTDHPQNNNWKSDATIIEENDEMEDFIIENAYESAETDETEKDNGSDEKREASDLSHNESEKDNGRDEKRERHEARDLSHEESEKDNGRDEKRERHEARDLSHNESEKDNGRDEKRERH